MIKWSEAPDHTSWGHGMVVADVEIDANHTLTLYCEASQTAKVDAMLAKLTAARAEVERLRGIVPEFLEKLNDELCAENERLRAEVEALRADEKRLLWLVFDTGIDGIGEFDLHDAAFVAADKAGREEPNDADYIAAIREAIDAELAKEQP